MRLVIILCMTVHCIHGFEDLTIMEYLSRHNFTSFLHYLQGRTSLVDRLGHSGANTIVAPVNSAFAQLLSTERGQYLLHSPIHMALTLERLIMQGFIMSPTMRDGEKIQTAGGMSLLVNRTHQNLVLGGMTVISSDIILNNGVVHVVNSLSLPPEFDLPTIKEIIDMNDGNFSTLRFLFSYFNMWSVFDTEHHHVLLAPTNAAFSRVETNLMSPEYPSAKAFYIDLLNSHIVDSGLHTLSHLQDGAALTNLNNLLVHVHVNNNLTSLYEEKPAINGVVIPIDKVLLPTDVSNPSLPIFG